MRFLEGERVILGWTGKAILHWLASSEYSALKLHLLLLNLLHTAGNSGWGEVWIEEEEMLRLCLKSGAARIRKAYRELKEELWYTRAGIERPWGWCRMPLHAIAELSRSCSKGEAICLFLSGQQLGRTFAHHRWRFRLNGRRTSYVTGCCKSTVAKGAISLRRRGLIIRIHTKMEALIKGGGYWCWSDDARARRGKRPEYIPKDQWVLDMKAKQRARARRLRREWAIRREREKLYPALKEERLRREKERGFRYTPSPKEPGDKAEKRGDQIHNISDSPTPEEGKVTPQSPLVHNEHANLEYQREPWMTNEK